VKGNNERCARWGVTVYYYYYTRAELGWAVAGSFACSSRIDVDAARLEVPSRPLARTITIIIMPTSDKVRRHPEWKTRDKSRPPDRPRVPPAEEPRGQTC